MASLGVTRREAALLTAAVGSCAFLAGCGSGSGDGGSSDASSQAVSSESVSAGVAATSAPSAVSGYESYWVYNPSGVKATGVYVDADLHRTMDTEGLTEPARLGESNSPVEDLYTDDLYNDVNDLFMERGWGDGLPIVPPVEQNMVRMCKGTDLPRETAVATIAPLMGQATVEKVAANAVMAGCAPAYLPVVLAAVDAVSDAAYDLVGVGTTTSPNVTMVIVDGPVADEIGMNRGANALGRGCRANATIGRAVHLAEQNIGGSHPRVSDYSTLGNVGEFAGAFAENEDANPWEPLHVERGFDPGQSVVTVASAESFQLVMDIGVDDRGFLDRVVRSVCAQHWRLEKDYMLLLTPLTAEKLSKAGWDKASIREYVMAGTRVYPSQLDQNLSEGLEKTGHVDGVGEADEDGMIPLSLVRSLEIVVAGGTGEKNEVVPLWSPAVSREVALPKGWDKLVAGL